MILSKWLDCGRLEVKYKLHFERRHCLLSERVSTIFAKPAFKTETIPLLLF